MSRRGPSPGPGGWPVLLAMALVISGCGDREVPEGRRPGPAHRVVSLLPNATEILFALGAGDRVVGVTRYCDRPAEARQRPQVGGILDASREAVLGLRPDLVVGSPAVLQGHLASLLIRSGARVLPLSFQEIEEVEPGIRALGEALGLSPQAEALCQSFRQEWASLRGVLARNPPIRVLVIVGRNPLMVAGETSFLGALVRHMGLRNVVEGENAWPHWSPEEVLRSRPDLIVDAVVEESAPGRPPEVLPGLPLIPIPDVGLLRPGPGLPGAARALAEQIRRAREGDFSVEEPAP